MAPTTRPGKTKEVSLSLSFLVCGLAYSKRVVGLMDTILGVSEKP